MVSPIPEFVDTYSDDVIFLRSVRRSLLRHPLESHEPRLLDATLARLYVVMLVGNIENALSEESKRTGDPLLRTYLNAGAPNTAKVHALRDYLQQGLGPDAIDAEVLADYLAVKYLRNGIIHARRRTGPQAQYVVERGFPTDSRSLDLDHLHRLAEIDSAIIMYLGLSRIRAGRALAATGAIATPSSRIASDAEVLAPFTDADFLATHKRNLSLVARSWERLVSVGVDAAADHPLFAVIAALRGSGDDAPTAAVRTWARSAVYSWGEIVRLWPDGEARRIIEDGSYRARLLQTSRAIGGSGAYPVVPLPASTYRRLLAYEEQGGDVGIDRWASLFEGAPDGESEDLLEFYALGEVAYSLTAGIPLGWVWVILAGNEFSESGDIALSFVDLWELANRWHSAIEHHAAADSTIFDDARRLIGEAQRR